MTNAEIAQLIKEYFFEGYDPYIAPSTVYNIKDRAWEESNAKIIYDQLIKNDNF